MPRVRYLDFNYYLLSIIIYFTESESSSNTSVCVTTKDSPSNPGVKCALPFRYNGEMHESCITGDLEPFSFYSWSSNFAVNVLEDKPANIESANMILLVK